MIQPAIIPMMDLFLNYKKENEMKRFDRDDASNILN